jgi:hypothetical protein
MIGEVRLASDADARRFVLRDRCARLPGEECPYVPGVMYVDWPVDDPVGQDEATMRSIIADLDQRVRALLVELVPDIELPPSVIK